MTNGVSDRSRTVRIEPALHQWLAELDFDEGGKVRRAEMHLAGFAEGDTPLLAAAARVQASVDRSEDRQPIRAALVRLWARHRILGVPGFRYA